MGQSITTKTVDIKDQATPALRELMEQLRGERINYIIGASARNTVRDHLIKREQTHPNKQGWPRVHFWAEAARSTHHDVLPDGAVVSVSHVGMAQRYYGGRIEAEDGGWLTIPARAEAYGRRARWFHNLHFELWKPDLAVLVENESTDIKRTKKGIKAGRERGGLVYYWLKHEVVQDGDESVLPTEEEIINAITKDLREFLERRRQ